MLEIADFFPARDLTLTNCAVSALLRAAGRKFAPPFLPCARAHVTQPWLVNRLIEVERRRDGRRSLGAFDENLAIRCDHAAWCAPPGESRQNIAPVGAEL